MSTERQPLPRPVPTYDGRALPRPDEELVDQGLGFDVATLLSRRSALRVFGLGAAALGLAACEGGSGGTMSSSSSSSTVNAASGEIPDETAGPYPGDGSNGPDVLEQSGVIRSDIRSSFGDASGAAEGVQMTLELTIKDLANGGKAFEGVAVYVWHCNRDGQYSLYSQGVQDQNYLRGVQIADSTGKVRSPASSRPATPAAGRTSTSRSIPIEPASPMPRRPSPRRKSRCPKAPASRCMPSRATSSPSRTSPESAWPATTSSATTPLPVSSPRSAVTSRPG
jgi:hypothetical protein